MKHLFNGCRIIDTLLEACQLEIRATKIAEALLADESIRNVRNLSLGRCSLAHT